MYCLRTRQCAYSDGAGAYAAKRHSPGGVDAPFSHGGLGPAAAALACLAALADAGKKTTKPIPAGLSELASQHASDHTSTVGSRDRLYENLRGFNRALPRGVV